MRPQTLRLAACQPPLRWWLRRKSSRGTDPRNAVERVDTMPRKNSPHAADEPIRDIPSAGFTCGSYLDGHNVHYIPALKLAGERDVVDARLVWDHDTLQLTIDGKKTVVFNHNPASVRVLLDDLGARCSWYPSLRLACWPGTYTRRWVSLSLDDLQACTSVEQARIAEAELWA